MKITDVPKTIARAAIRVYQMVLSPLIGNQCRFHPSCSNYALEAVERHGALKGGWLAARRLSRCSGWQTAPGSPDATSSSRGTAGSC